MKWYDFTIENWKGKLLWILHPFDTREKHSERYYNLKSVQKVIKQINESTRKEVNKNDKATINATKR